MSTIEIKIDRGVPIPPSRRGRGGANRESKWSALDIGDSVFVAKPQSVVTATVGRFAKKTGRRFTSRLVTENDVVGTRIWRVA